MEESATQNSIRLPVAHFFFSVYLLRLSSYFTQTGSYSQGHISHEDACMFSSLHSILSESMQRTPREWTPMCFPTSVCSTSCLTQE